MIMVDDTVSSVSSTAVTITPQSIKKTPVKFKDFEVLLLLGEGSFGKVYKVRHRETN